MLQPWYWRSLPLEHRTGSEVLAALFLRDSAEGLLGGREGQDINYECLHTAQAQLMPLSIFDL